MDDLTTILKELTEKGYTNIETYFNDDDELILYCEKNNGDTITLTLIGNDTFDLSLFIGNVERHNHNIGITQVILEIGKI